MHDLMSTIAISARMPIGEQSNIFHISYLKLHFQLEMENSKTNHNCFNANANVNVRMRGSGHWRFMHNLKFTLNFTKQNNYFSFSLFRSWNFIASYFNLIPCLLSTATHTRTMPELAQLVAKTKSSSILIQIWFYSNGWSLGSITIL